MAGKKSTNVEIDARIEKVYDLLLNAYTRNQIMRYAAIHWGVAERQTETYLRRARDLLVEDSKIRRSQWLTEALARNRETERKAMDSNQLGVAIACQKLQAQLLQFKMTGG